jgi:predicted small lipoprotein YifL
MRSDLIHTITWFTLAILLLLLEGCGHKGPLILPPEKVEPPQTQPTSQQTPDQETPALPPSQQSK